MKQIILEVLVGFVFGIIWVGGMLLFSINAGY
jgi:hypothetical protein